MCDGNLVTAGAIGVRVVVIAGLAGSSKVSEDPQQRIVKSLWKMDCFGRFCRAITLPDPLQVGDPSEGRSGEVENLERSESSSA